MDDSSDDLQGRLERLPGRHLAVLRGALCGFDVSELAALLGVPEESVRPTLRLAAAKLVAVLAEPTGARGTGSRG